MKPEKVHQFSDSRQALAFIEGYAGRLRGATDQEVAIEAIHLAPPSPRHPPLLLIGGMGPLAGAEGFQKACRLFAEAREILLFQACTVPDRTAAIQADLDNPASAAKEAVISALTAALVGAARLLSDQVPITCIVLCNSAHYFLRETFTRLNADDPATAARLVWRSLIDAVVTRMRAAGPKRTLVAATTGTLLGGLYTKPLREAGLSLQPLADNLQSLLMRAVYDGVKSFDQAATLALGSEFFETVYRRHSDIDAVLAGCTEIPTILAAVTHQGPPHLQAFLAGLTIYDPVEAALHLMAEDSAFTAT